jgi:formylglycine-generating enzyme required for sulfatase activity
MAKIPGLSVCIDRFEASVKKVHGKEIAVSRKGAMPVTNISFLQAKKLCENAGKRMCTLPEWERACRGNENRDYPYGKTFDKKKCNAVYLYDDPTKSKPVPAGSMEECKTPEGVYDLSGNLWEWIDEEDQTGSLRLLIGGGFSNLDYMLGCKPNDEAFQPVDVAGEGLGFRCCKDLSISNK